MTNKDIIICSRCGGKKLIGNHGHGGSNDHLGICISCKGFGALCSCSECKDTREGKEVKKKPLKSRK